MHERRLLKSVAASLVGLGALFVLAQDAPPLPAPTEDRVGFPEGWDTDYEELYVLDRPDNKQVRVIYGNDEAATAVAGEPFPYGSILVMATHSALLGEDETPTLDDAGRYQRGELGGLFVMRKEPGFGEAYEENRSGEWEYTAYRPDGSYITEPQASGRCAACHLQQIGADDDYVARAELFYHDASGAVPNGVIRQYTFVPQAISVAEGATVTWYNDDVIEHTITSQAFDSGNLPRGATFSHTFEEAGEFSFACAIHPEMTGTVVVEASQ